MIKKITSLMFILIIASTVFCASAFAATKNDIISFVNAQSVCGDTGIFNTYKATFTRLLKQKDLSESELNTIYSYLQSTVGLLNSKGVCKLADLSKLTSSEKSTVYNNLMTAANIITKAPAISDSDTEQETPNTPNVPGNDVDNNETNKPNTSTKPVTKPTTKPVTKPSEEEGTKITINTQDGTMDIYENGVLVDKIDMNASKMTYVGVNTTYVMLVIICILVFVISLIPSIRLAKEHTAKNRFFKNIFTSLMICSAIVATVIIVWGSKIETVMAMVDMLSITDSGKEITVELNEDKSIKKYPSYGVNYGTVKVPSVGIENNVYFGDMTTILSLGIGHTTWSDMPTEGGVTVYSGHNRENMLGGLKDIAKNDEIIIETSYATCTYKVYKTEILKDYETDKLKKINDKETLIIYTCHPFGSYVYTNKRFVVYSVLDSIVWK